MTGPRTRRHRSTRARPGRKGVAVTLEASEAGRLSTADARNATAALTWWQRLIRSRVGWHVLALGVMSTYVFSVHRDALFYHLDGALALQLIEAQHRWLPFSASLGLDPYRGPGNLFLPFNTRWVADHERDAAPRTAASSIAIAR